MAHGSPDWGWRGPKKTTYGLDDMGELAVRLESPNVFDRRGDTVWASDFREGRGDITAFGTAGSEARLLTGFYPRHGAYCVGLYLPDAVDGNVGLRKYLPYPVSSLVGVEATVNMPAALWTWGWHIRVRRGLTELQARVHYDAVAGTLEYQNALNVYVEFAAGLNLQVLNTCAVTGKMVVDIDAEEYVRFIFNEVEYPMTDLGCFAWNLVATRRFEAEMVAYNVDDDEMEAYIDCVIVTQNEPA